MPKGIPGRVKCKVAECPYLVNTQGLCNTHLRRLRDYGDPLFVPPPNGRPKRFCPVEDCGKPAFGHGFCGKHWKRWRKTGDPLGFVRRPSPEERFWQRVDKNGPQSDVGGRCWTWTGAKSSLGYGRVTIHRKTWLTHRYAYTLIVGEIPNGLELDHLCRNASCCNPGHLEPVTHRENMLRGNGMSGRHARSTHCVRGHPRSPENTRVDANGWRHCIPCLKIRSDERRKRVGDRRAVDRIVVAERDNWTCGICGNGIDPEAPFHLEDGHYNPEYLNVDHIVPVAAGGAHSYENVQATHARCNNRKHLD